DGPVAEAVAEADGVDQAVVPVAVGFAPGDRKRQQDVLLGAEDGEEVEGLEDEADAVAAGVGGALVVEVGGLGAVDRDGPGGLAGMCSSVDLPEPDGPMIAAKRPCGNVTLTPASASIAASPSP